MFELTIKDVVYQFKFGIGFVREINKKVSTKDANGAEQGLGLQYAIANLIDGDVVGLVDILDLANKTEKPRVTRGALEDYLDDEETDIDQIFKDVLDFFASANATKKMTAAVMEMVETEKAKLAQKQ